MTKKKRTTSHLPEDDEYQEPDLSGVRRLSREEFRDPARREVKERRAKAALKGVRTRKQYDSNRPTLERFQVSLPPALRDKARHLIDGNFSQAVRMALVEAVRRREHPEQFEDIEERIGELKKALEEHSHRLDAIEAALAEE